MIVYTTSKVEKHEERSSLIPGNPVIRTWWTIDGEEVGEAKARLASEIQILGKVPFDLDSGKQLPTPYAVPGTVHVRKSGAGLSIEQVGYRLIATCHTCQEGLVITTPYPTGRLVDASCPNCGAPHSMWWDMKGESGA